MNGLIRVSHTKYMFAGARLMLWWITQIIRGNSVGRWMNKMQVSKEQLGWQHFALSHWSQSFISTGWCDAGRYYDSGGARAPWGFKPPATRQLVQQFVMATKKWYIEALVLVVTITLTNDDPVHRRICASQGRNESIHIISNLWLTFLMIRDSLQTVLIGVSVKSRPPTPPLQYNSLYDRITCFCVFYYRTS